MITRPLLLWGHDVVGIDIDCPSIEYGKALLQEAGFDSGRLSCVSLDDLEGSFDVLIASEVLEHLDDAQLDEVLALTRARLVPGGRLFVTVPNGYGWFELERLLWFPTGLDWLFRRRLIAAIVSKIKLALTAGYFDVEHLSTLAHSPHRQRFTWRSVRRVLERAGFDVAEQRGSVLVCGPISHLLPNWIPASNDNRPLSRKALPSYRGWLLLGRNKAAGDFLRSTLMFRRLPSGGETAPRTNSSGTGRG
jgi:SAM-dependent methyltransferase